MPHGNVYRSDEIGTAYDGWYAELPPNARLLWWTLKNSRDMKACGLAVIAVPTLCFETALSRDEVVAAIEAISKPFKSSRGDDYARVVYWEKCDTFWVRNFYERQRANSNATNFDGAARKALACFPDELQVAVLATYPTLATNESLPIISEQSWDGDGMGDGMVHPSKPARKIRQKPTQQEMLGGENDPESTILGGIPSPSHATDSGMGYPSHTPKRGIPSPQQVNRLTGNTLTPIESIPIHPPTDVADDGGELDFEPTKPEEPKKPEKWELQFEEFWKPYPRRNGTERGAKQTARAAFQKLTAMERVAALAQVVVYARLPHTLRENGKYIPDAVRWLKEKRWEVVEPEPSAARVMGQDSETPPKGYSWARDGEGNWKKLGRDRVTGELPWPDLDVTGNDVLESKMWREYGNARRPMRPASEGLGDRAGGTA